VLLYEDLLQGNGKGVKGFVHVNLKIDFVMLLNANQICYVVINSPELVISCSVALP